MLEVTVHRNYTQYVGIYAADGRQIRQDFMHSTTELDKKLDKKSATIHLDLKMKTWVKLVLQFKHL